MARQWVVGVEEGVAGNGGVQNIKDEGKMKGTFVKLYNFSIKMIYVNQP